MKQLFFVFIGGGIGSVLRYLISFIFKNNSYNFPWSTFIVNMIGCFLIGLIFGYLNKNEYLKDSLTSILIVGFCGGFTTFSTFASENFQLFKSEYFLRPGFSIKIFFLFFIQNFSNFKFCSGGVAKIVFLILLLFNI